MIFPGEELQSGPAMPGAPVIPAGTPPALEAALARAVACLRQGGLLAYPTESFYGLGADVYSERALKRLFAVKQRARNQPILMLIPSRESLGRYVTRVSPLAGELMDAFWPGGLTLVFEAAAGLSPILTAGSGRIGVRLSSHPVAGALARALGKPISGTSANLTGQPACRTAGEVNRSLGTRLDLILDGGKTPGQAASTVLDVTVSPPRILREGMISAQRLAPFTKTS